MFNLSMKAGLLASLVFGLSIGTAFADVSYGCQRQAAPPVPLVEIEAPGTPPEIGWFVVPTSTGVRGRVAETFAIHERNRKDMIVVLRWRSMRR